MVFFSKQSVSKAGNFRPEIGSSFIKSAKSVTKLDISLDNILEMQKQGHGIYKSCYYQVSCIANIRQYITT